MYLCLCVYRKHYLGSWLEKVQEEFKECKTMPDWGRSVQWPAPPIAIKVLLNMPLMLTVF